MSLELNKLYAAINDSRDEHQAVIAGASSAWGAYVNAHHKQYADGDKKKYHLVNAKGERIQAANDPSQLNVVNGTVRHEDFLVIQEEITRVRRRSLNGINDLDENGLSFGVGIEEQLVGFENINEFSEAEQQMNPNSFQNNDTVFTKRFTPNPITHQSFSVPWRQGSFDYKRSLGMGESMRQVAERLEETLFNGNTAIVVNFDGVNYPIYGYTTHPQRGTGTISDWSLPANRTSIVPELIEQVGAMWAGQGGVSNHSVMVYVGNDVWTQFQQDYKDETSGSVMKRVMEVPMIKGVKAAEKLAPNEVVLVEMERRTIQLAKASDIIMVPHTKVNPMAPQVMTTYAAMVHQIKVDSKLQTGIRHLTV